MFTFLLRAEKAESIKTLSRILKTAWNLKILNQTNSNLRQIVLFLIRVQSKWATEFGKYESKTDFTEMMAKPARLKFPPPDVLTNFSCSLFARNLKNGYWISTWKISSNPCKSFGGGLYLKCYCSLFLEIFLTFMWFLEY